MTLFEWTKGYRWRFAAGGVALLLTNALGYSVPQLLKLAIDTLQKVTLQKNGDRQQLALIAGAIFAVAVVQGVIRIFSRLLIFNAARDIEGDIRHALFRHTLHMAPRELDNYKVGDLQSRLTNDLTNVRLLYGAGLLNIVNTVLAYLCAFPLLIIESWKLTLVALAPYPVVIVVMRLVAKRIFRYSGQAQAKLGELSNLISEDLGARLFITAAGLQGLEERRFAEKNSSYLQMNLALVRTRALMQPMVSILSSLGIALALLVGGRQVIAGEMTLGTLVAFTAYLGLLAWPTLMFAFMTAMWQRGLASYGRIRELFGKPTWESAPGSKTLSASTRCDIRLRDLSLRRGQHEVLRALNLTIAAGSRVGLVGEVGSGKSSLLQVLARLQEVPAKTYFIDQEDVSDLSLESVRGRIGLVPQQPFLFSLTIAENIAFARPQSTPLEIARAARQADVEKDILRFNDAFATLVGERGVTLSGGQRQRIALARALLSEPDLLLLDDCFSAVDAETEERIITELLGYWGNKTVVIATHRLAVLDHVERIVVLDSGRIIEDGSPAELLARPSRYAELYRKQRLRDLVAAASETSAESAA